MDFTKMNKVVATFKNAKRDLTFKTLENVEGDVVYKVNGVFPVNNEFGLKYFLSLEKDGDFFNFSLPINENDNAHTIITNSECIQAINNGECGVKIGAYFNKKYKRKCSTIEWVNIQ